MPFNKLFINLIVSGINVFILARYIYLLYHKKISPSLAMWTFFSLAVGISLFTYFAEGEHSISDNMLNFTDLIMVVSVSVAILIWGDHSTRFNRFDVGCLVAVIGIIAFWGISSNHVIANYSVQSIMVISYFPVLGRMTHQKKNTEAFSVWIMMLVAAGISLFASKGWLASVYAIRAIVCTGALLLLMVRIEIVNRKNADSLLH
ncbi:MAG: hypothetical protein Q7U54_11845 [Bacteroidales bacterium]|nr:hypothetical protein [Bacteroidales bacterium]